MLRKLDTRHAAQPMGGSHELLHRFAQGLALLLSQQTGEAHNVGFEVCCGGEKEGGPL